MEIVMWHCTLLWDTSDYYGDGVHVGFLRYLTWKQFIKWSEFFFVKDIKCLFTCGSALTMFWRKYRVYQNELTDQSCTWVICRRVSFKFCKPVWLGMGLYFRGEQQNADYPDASYKKHWSTEAQKTSQFVCQKKSVIKQTENSDFLMSAWVNSHTYYLYDDRLI